MSHLENLDKNTIKEEIKANVKRLYRKEFKEATEKEIFQAVSLVVKDEIIDDWLATQNAMEQQDPKTVYYMSMEFLMGRALGNNMLNLCVYDEFKQA